MVIDRADEILKKITNTYLEPNKALPELSEMANTGLIDPLRNFSEACRRIRASQFRAASLGRCTHKSRLVSSGFPARSDADIRQRIEHVCFGPMAEWRVPLT